MSSEAAHAELLLENIMKEPGLSYFREFMDRRGMLRLLQVWITLDSFGIQDVRRASGSTTATKSQHDHDVFLQDSKMIFELYLTLPEIAALLPKDSLSDIAKLVDAAVDLQPPNSNTTNLSTDASQTHSPHVRPPHADPLLNFVFPVAAAVVTSSSAPSSTSTLVQPSNLSVSTTSTLSRRFELLSSAFSRVQVKVGESISRDFLPLFMQSDLYFKMTSKTTTTQPHPSTSKLSEVDSAEGLRVTHRVRNTRFGSGSYFSPLDPIDTSVDRLNAAPTRSQLTSLLITDNGTSTRDALFKSTSTNSPTPALVKSSHAPTSALSFPHTASSVIDSTFKRKEKASHPSSDNDTNTLKRENLSHFFSTVALFKLASTSSTASNQEKNENTKRAESAPAFEVLNGKLDAADSTNPLLELNDESEEVRSIQISTIPTASRLLPVDAPESTDAPNFDENFIMLPTSLIDDLPVKEVVSVLDDILQTSPSDESGDETALSSWDADDATVENAEDETDETLSAATASFPAPQMAPLPQQRVPNSTDSPSLFLTPSQSPGSPPAPPPSSSAFVTPSSTSTHVTQVEPFGVLSGSSSNTQSGHLVISNHIQLIRSQLENQMKQRSMLDAMILRKHAQLQHPPSHRPQQQESSQRILRRVRWECEQHCESLRLQLSQLELSISDNVIVPGWC